MLPAPTTSAITVLYRPEAVLDSQLDGRVDNVARHETTEESWKAVVSAIVNRALSFQTPKSHYLECLPGYSLWNATLASGGNPFQEGRTQMQLVKVVLQSRYKREVTDGEAHSKRGLIVSYKPDMTHFLKVKYDLSILTLVVLVAAFKTTQLDYENGKPVVLHSCLDPREDDFHAFCDIDTHISWSTSAGGRRASQVLRLDGIEKGRACLARLAVHLLLAHEYCGAFMGYAMVGPRFCRVLHGEISGQPVMFIECVSPSPDAACGLSMADFLSDDSNVAQLPWDISESDPDEPSGEYRAKPDTLRVLLDFSALSMDVLAQHPRTVPLERLRPLGDLSALVREKLSAISTTVYACAEKEDFVLPSHPKHMRAVAPAQPTSRNDGSDTDTDDDNQQSKMDEQPAPKRRRRSSHHRDSLARDGSSAATPRVKQAINTWREDVRAALGGKELGKRAPVALPAIGGHGEGHTKSHSESSDSTVEHIAPVASPSQLHPAAGLSNANQQGCPQGKQCDHPAISNEDYSLAEMEATLPGATEIEPEDSCSRSEDQSSEGHRVRPIIATTPELLQLMRELGVIAVPISTKEMGLILDEIKASCSPADQEA